MFDYQGKQFESDYFYVDWKIGDQCNFKCSYCSQQNVLKSPNYPSIKQIDNAIKVLSKIKSEKFDFTIAGGETTLYPDLFYLLDQIYNKIENLNKITICTNGSKSLKYFNRLKKHLKNPDKFFLYLSIHPEYIKPNITFLNKIKYLSETFNLQLALMFKKTKSFSKILSLIFNLYESGCNIYPKLVLLRSSLNFNELNSNEYTSEDLSLAKYVNLDWYNRRTEDRDFVWIPDNKKIKEHNNLLVDGDLNFRNMHCVHGATSLWIDTTGKCRGAVCHEGKESRFSIYDGINPYVFNDFIQICRCSLKTCGCKDNLMIPKFKKLEDAKKFVSELNF